MNTWFWVLLVIAIIGLLLLIGGIAWYYHLKNAGNSTTWAWVLIAIGAILLLVGIAGCLYFGLV